MPDTSIDTLLVCENGHVITDSLNVEPREARRFCPDCGKPTFSSCPRCSLPIPGAAYSTTITGRVIGKLQGAPRPDFCGHCGYRYCWPGMKEATVCRNYGSMGPDQYRIELRNMAAHAEGTWYFLAQRAGKLKNRITLKDAFTVAIPLLLLTIHTYFKDAAWAYWAFVISALVQVVLSVLGILKWSETYLQLMAAASGNRDISERCKDLANNAPDDGLSFSYALVKKDFDHRVTGDEQFHPTLSDKKKGMQYTLFINQRACEICKNVPKCRPEDNPKKKSGDVCSNCGC